MTKRVCVVVAFLFSLTFHQTGLAEPSAQQEPSKNVEKPLRIAVAANFEPILEELIGHYESEQKIAVSVGSTGALTAQVRNGAPFDLLLAADVDSPEHLEGLGLTRQRKTYAYGRLAFWQPKASNVSEASLRGMSGAVAIANPRHAPYGVAAVAVLQKTGKNGLKQIKGNNVAQAFSFVQTGNVRAGLVALSQLRYTGKATDTYWIIPPDFHQPIEQQAVVTKGADTRAEAFLRFLDSTVARQIINQAGYDLEVSHD